ncbi:hypothetical protein CCMSSC00406_0008284 [Pleurotus cornucopiae]|uniref:Uncharacterized protein n=1 Tax=Pleurotus cornucopiae TaxID=5321 RepID=A0ACB7J920_PLECO|nr:hypothetical protein CCMSSC00406_0008284 [Pleurotus cornucopiae]
MNTERRVLSEPFIGGHGDIILCSRDGVDFQVYKVIMVVASPFFRDMFSLPDSPGRNVYQGGKPVIDMQETSLTLDNLLRFCYPIENPKVSDRKAFQKVMAAADKFRMEFLFGVILESFGLSQLAKDSMRRCLDHSLPELVDQAQDTDLTYLSTSDYHQSFSITEHIAEDARN